jgi:hypothetical protein
VHCGEAPQRALIAPDSLVFVPLATQLPRPWRELPTASSGFPWKFVLWIWICSSCFPPEHKSRIRTCNKLIHIAQSFASTRHLTKMPGRPSSDRGACMHLTFARHQWPIGRVKHRSGCPAPTPKREAPRATLVNCPEFLFAMSYFEHPPLPRSCTMRQPSEVINYERRLPYESRDSAGSLH